MLESTVEDQVCKWVESEGGKTYKVKIESQRGFPDRLIILPGMVLFVELKRPKGGKVSPQQKLCLKELRDRGHHAFVCRSLAYLQGYVEGVRENATA